MAMSVAIGGAQGECVLDDGGFGSFSEVGASPEGCLLFHQKRKSKLGGSVGVPDRQHHY